MTKSNRSTLTVVILIGLVLVVGIISMLKLSRENRNTANASYEQLHGILFPTARTIQPFALRDGDGTSFTEHSLKGHWTVFFFGYTHCPDICPTTLATMNKVWEKLSPNAQSNLEIIFVSIDPERDTPESIEKYAHYFNPNFQAITGSPRQLELFTRQVGVAYFKIDEQDNQNYIINHTGSLMIFNPTGHYAGIISPPLDADTIASELESIVHSH